MPVTAHAGLGAGLSSSPDTVGDVITLRRLLTRAARATLKHENIRDAELSITLLTDGEIADMNQRFLQHDGPTDVVSFALYEAGETPVGDVYIGYEQALRQASADNVPPAEELVRLTVHGVLHVLGHDHPAGDDRVDSPMWIVQETIVAGVLRA